jgi:flagellar protein FlaI
MYNNETSDSIENNITAFRDFYPVNQPYGFVGIEINEDSGILKYHTVEPTLSEDEYELLTRIKSLIIDQMDVSLDVLKDPEQMDAYLRTQVQLLFKKFERKIPKESEDKFVYYLNRDFLGYGKIDLLMRDENIEDISCNGVKTPIYVWHRQYESIPTNVTRGLEGAFNTERGKQKR